EEVQVAQQVLQSLGLRSFTAQVTACPGCGRTTSTFFQEMAEQIQTYLREQRPVWQARYPGSEELRVAVMGCVVNGPGESKHADIGISLPGTAEDQFPDKIFRTVVLGDLRARVLHAKGGTEVDPQLVGGFAGLREFVGLHDAAYPDIDLRKIIVADLCHFGS